MTNYTKIFLLKEYTDCQPYEDELTKPFLAKEDVSQQLGYNIPHILWLKN